MDAIICNPYDYQTLRRIVNNDLLLRNSCSLATDYHIPRGHAYHFSLDRIMEMDEVIRQLTNKREEES